jgi:hypothetical protein
VDVALTPLPAGGGTTDPGPDVASGLAYSEVGTFRALPPGSYAVSVRRAGTPAATPPALTARVEVAPGDAGTVAISGRFADLSLQVLPEDLGAPPEGSARVRVLAAAAGTGSVDVVLDGGPALATGLPFGNAGDAVVVPAGPGRLVLRGAPGAPATLPVDLVSGSVVTLLVVDRPGGGLTARVVVDAAAPARVPVGAVEAGGGRADEPGSPVLAAVAGLALLAALGRREGRVLLMATAVGTAVAALPPGAPPAARPERVVDVPAATPRSAVVPTRLALPSAGVDTFLSGIDVDGSGALAPPADPTTAGWHAGSAVPGETGPAVIAGHVDWAGAPGIFARLDEVAVGDPVVVGRTDGTTQRFTVTRVVRYAKAAFPAAEVYGATPDAELRLITCGGAFDPVSGSYRDNVVVYARLI